MHLIWPLSCALHDLRQFRLSVVLTHPSATTVHMEIISWNFLRHGDRFRAHAGKFKHELLLRTVRMPINLIHVNRIVHYRLYYTVFRKKNTRSHFLSYLHELFVDLNKNCSEYTQGSIDSNHVKIRYSLRSMT